MFAHIRLPYNRAQAGTRIMGVMLVEPPKGQLCFDARPHGAMWRVTGSGIPDAGELFSDLADAIAFSKTRCLHSPRVVRIFNVEGTETAKLSWSGGCGEQADAN